VTRGSQEPSLLAQARDWARTGDARAEAAFQHVADAEPACVEAHVFIARHALGRGDTVRALQHLQQACRAEPGNPKLLRELAAVADLAGFTDEARQALGYAVAIAPNFYEAHLQLARLLERQGERHEATRSYFRALTRAQFDGQWLDDKTTPAHLLAQVRHAIAFVQRGRVEVLAGLLEPLQARFGSEAMRRVERCLMGYLGVDPVVPADPLQRPKFLFFPGLPSTPFFDTADIDWIDRIEAAFEGIRQEALQAIADDGALAPFLVFGADDPVENYLDGDAAAPPRWDALFFYRHGQRCAENHVRCPITSQALESLPLLRIAGHAPEICFSVLSPGTHILPHHGVTNVRAVVHLPLIVPGQCALTVGTQTHAWREGRCVAFDDTYRHEAWNRSGQTRVILLMDAWNPHLTEPERAAVTALIEGIGEFNRG
jgi:aspartate beta-hydroxylase